MSEETLVRAALHAAYGAPIDPAIVARGETAVRAAAVHRANQPSPTAASAPVIPMRRRRTARLFGRAAAAVLAAVLTVGTPGLAAAAHQAAPGDALYDVKLVVERVWPVLVPGDAATARVHLRLATRRLDELEGLQGAPGEMRARLLAAADEHLDRAERLGPAGLGDAIAALRARLDALTPAPTRAPGTRATTPAAAPRVLATPRPDDRPASRSPRLTDTSPDDTGPPAPASGQTNPAPRPANSPTPAAATGDRPAAPGSSGGGPGPTLPQPAPQPSEPDEDDDRDDEDDDREAPERPGDPDDEDDDPQGDDEDNEDNEDDGDHQFDD